VRRALREALEERVRAVDEWGEAAEEAALGAWQRRMSLQRTWAPEEADREAILGELGERASRIVESERAALEALEAAMA
jgi:hypothetical protein